MKRLPFLTLLAGLSWILAFPAMSHAALNRCIDGTGAVLITDEPCSGAIQIDTLAEQTDIYTPRFRDPRPVKAAARPTQRNIVAPGIDPSIPGLPPAPNMRAWPPWRN